MIRLFVIEDSPVTIGGIRDFFRARDGIRVTLQAHSMKEALLQGAPEQFDLILLDLWLNSGDPELPEQNVHKLLQKYPDKPVVVFTSEDSIVWERRMKEAGVRAYLRKTAQRKDIKAALEIVSKGGTVFSTTSDTYTEGSGYMQPTVQKTHALTQHQVRMLSLLAEGGTQEEMASALHVSTSAVEKGLAHLRQKFNVRTNAALIRFVTLHKLV